MSEQEMNVAQDTSSQVAEATPATNTEPQTETTAAPAAEPQVPTYTPNFKYKVLDEEKELPEDFRSFIKDEGTEKKFRELFEKADAIEHFKTKNGEYKQNLSTMQRESAELKEAIQEAGYFYSKGDFDAAFEKLGMNKENVLQWAIGELQLLQKPREERGLVEEKRHAEREAYSLNKQNQAYEQKLNNYIAEQKVMEFETITSRPDVSKYVSGYERINGKGSFRRDVAYRGDMAWQYEEKNLPVELVVNQIMQGYKIPELAEQPTQAITGVRKETPVIPNVQSKSSSPLSSPITSIEQIRKLAQR